jgi:hypothetical protein
VLADQAEPGVDIDRVIRMLLLHDLVEIDAGDHPIHGNHDRAAQEAAERAAADRIFALLPDDQAGPFRALWDEFEAGESPDARFARALDRVQPPLLNAAAGGAPRPPAAARPRSGPMSGTESRRFLRVCDTSFMCSREGSASATGAAAMLQVRKRSRDGGFSRSHRPNSAGNGHSCCGKVISRTIVEETPRQRRHKGRSDDPRDTARPG